MRGEQSYLFFNLFISLGSPPLARGTVLINSISSRLIFITPACAGNRAPYAQSKPLPWDHPRLRGGQFMAFSFSFFILGSPPLARGTDFRPSLSLLLVRITPACAGNSRHICRYPRRRWDHPRLRGEQKTALYTASMSMGSPPLARGTVLFTGQRGSSVGITPACAGNRSTRAAKSPWQRDHPRLRGEQDICEAVFKPSIGSPPLARGTDICEAGLYNHAGITPACAGNRRRSRKSFSASMDHPRLRGEQIAQLEQANNQLGSPPLARGTVTTACAASKRTGSPPLARGTD